MNPKVAFVGVYLTLSMSYADTVQLNEKLIVKLAREDVPASLQARAMALQAERMELGLREAWSTQLVTSATYQDSSEKAFAVFIPTFGPNTDLSVGVKKAWLPGVSTSASIFTAQQSTESGSIDRATRTGFRAGLSVDLWKNFLGRLNKANLSNLELKRQRAEHQSYIQSRSAELALRKVYWSLVANEESRKVTTQQVAFSSQQLFEAKKRYRSSVADKGELARYEAQHASRVSQMGSLDYQRHILLETLRQQLPSLTEKELVLGPYDVEAAIVDVVACAEVIKEQSNVPWNQTRYDELIEISEKEYQSQARITDTHSAMDITLDANFQVSGVDQGYGRSLEDFRDNGRGGFNVGVNLVLPLDGRSDATERKQEKLDKALFLAEKHRLKGQIVAQHIETGNVVRLLSQVLASQKKNTQMLEESLKDSTRKFKQARISLQELIRDQDALLSSLFSEIDTKLAVLNRLLDYFSYFTESECQINQIGVEVKS